MFHVLFELLYPHDRVWVIKKNPKSARIYKENIYNEISVGKFNVHRVSKINHDLIFFIAKCLINSH